MIIDELLDDLEYMIQQLQFENTKYYDALYTISQATHKRTTSYHKLISIAQTAIEQKEKTCTHCGKNL